jgi:hypothetical protein
MKPEQNKIAEKIVDALERQGATLAADRAGVFIVGACPEHLEKLLNRHRRQVVAFLLRRQTAAAVARRAWIHIARQVIASEFYGADRKTLQTLEAGLRTLPHHPLCQLALRRLDGMRTKKEQQR